MSLLRRVFLGRAGRERAAALAGAAERLYAAAVTQARQPAFYAALGVPDTLEGRFELVVLHAHLLSRRLGSGGQGPLAQALFDHMFRDFERNLRELGVGDPGIPRRVKAMVNAYYGRAASYEAGLAGPDGMLAEALALNVLGRAPAPGAVPASEATVLAAYVRATVAGLAAAPIAALAGGEVSFPPAPERP
jgi:cytochrome b pre-mRNA-processing protein 3